MIITSSIRIVYKIVGQGRPAVRSRSNNSRGVVMTLYRQPIFRKFPDDHEPINISNVKDLSVEAVDF